MGELIESLLSTLTPAQVTNFVIWSIILFFISSLIFATLKKCHDLVSYTPTLLTTLGIFGTFVGIVIGLLDFDHTNIDESITALLAGLKTAFITSLCGMASSLIFKIITTTILKPHSIDEAPEASPELILAAIEAQVTETKSLKEALVGNDDSTLFGQLKILRGDINDNAKLQRVLAEQHFNQEQEKYGEFSEKLWLKMQDFADTLSKSATEQVIEALKQVIVDFNNNLTEQFGENFKRLNDAVLLLVDWQENYKHQLIEMEKQYQNGVSAITATELSISNISESSAEIPKSMESLQQVMSVNQHQLAELERHLEAFKDMRDAAVVAVPEIREQIQKTVTDIGNSVDVASEHYSQLLTKSDDYINKHMQVSESLLEKFVTDTTNGIDAVGNKLVEGSQVIEKSIDIAATEFTNNAARTNESLYQTSDHLGTQSEVIKQHLKDTVSDLNNTMRDMISKLVDDSQQINTTLKDANSHLITDTKTVRDTFVQSTEQLQYQLKDMLETSAAEQVNQARRTFDAMEQSIKQQVGLTGEAVEQQVAVIDQAMQQEINRVMNEMGTSLASIAGQFTNDYQQLTLAMQRIVSEKAEY